MEKRLRRKKGKERKRLFKYKTTKRRREEKRENKKGKGRTRFNRIEKKRRKRNAVEEVTFHDPLKRKSYLVESGQSL